MPVQQGKDVQITAWKVGDGRCPAANRPGPKRGRPGRESRGVKSDPVLMRPNNMTRNGKFGRHPAKSSRPGLRLPDIKAVRKGTLPGFAATRLPNGLIINDVTIGESNGEA